MKSEASEASETLQYQIVASILGQPTLAFDGTRQREKDRFRSIFLFMSQILEAKGNPTLAKQKLLLKAKTSKLNQYNQYKLIPRELGKPY